MKVISKWLLCLFVLALVLTGCKPSESKQEEGNKGASTEGAEITVQAEAGWLDLYKTVAEKVEAAHPGSKINLKEVGSFDHLDLLNTTDATNPDFADVFALPLDRFTDLVSQDVLGALDAKKMAQEIGNYDDFDSNLGGFFKVGDDYLAFPYNIETLVTFVNTKNAADQGIDATKPIELMDIKDPANVLLPFFDAWFGVSAANSAKLDLLKQDGDKFMSSLTRPWSELSDDEKGMFETIYKYWKMHEDANTPLFSGESEGWDYIGTQFTTGGKGVIRLGGPWEVNDNVEKAGENLEIYPINHITINKKPLAHWQGGWAMAINARIEKDPAKVMLAEAFIVELLKPENAAALFKAAGKILPNVSVEDYKKTDLSDLDKKTIENVIESYKVSTPRPIFKEFGQVWDTWKNAILSWNSVKPANAEAAYNELKASFDAMMANLEK